MAYTINEQPAALIYSRSPVLYQVYDSTNTGLTSYRYLAEVYVWEGAVASVPGSPQFSLERYPNTTSSAYFNIQQLLQEYFDEMNPTIPDQFSDSLIYNVQVDFGYTYVNSGTPTTVQSEATSNIIQFVNGYTSFPKGINYINSTNTGQSYPTAYAQRVVDDGGTIESIGCVPTALDPLTGGEFMTDAPRSIIIPSYQRYTMSLYYKKTTSKVQDVKIWDDNSNTYTFDLSVIVTNSDSSEKFVLTLDVGSDKFNTYALNPTRYWYVQGFDDKGDEVTQKYTFELDCKRKWGYIQIQFLNKYGAWDYVPMWGRADDTLTVERSKFLRDTLSVVQAAISYNVYDAKYRDDNIKGRVVRKLNTGWLDEEYAEVMKQLYLSPMVVDQATLLPYNVKGNSVPVMNFNNDQLLNWTVDFEEAFEHINSVG
jgi:hypothetical protein